MRRWERVDSGKWAVGEVRAVRFGPENVSYAIRVSPSSVILGRHVDFNQVVGFPTRSEVSPAGVAAIEGKTVEHGGTSGEVR